MVSFKHRSSINRVLICSDHLPPSGGGVEVVVEELATTLCDRGIEVILFSLDDNPSDLSNKLQYPDITVESASPIDLTSRIGLQSSISLDAFPRLSSVIDEYDPDIIHVHNRFFFTSYIGALIKSIKSECDAPLIVSLHLGSISDIGGYTGKIACTAERIVGRQLLRASDQLIAVSDAVADHAIALGADREKTTVIPNGVDTDYFSPQGQIKKPNSVTNLLFVGRLVRNKGPQYFVKAVAKLVQDNLDVTGHIVGEGPLKPELVELASENGISDHIQFHGYVEDMSKTMREADLFCRPSLSEGMPLTLLEAMASRLPVVVTEVAGVPEVVNDGKTGVLVPSHDSEAVAQSISQLVERPEYAAKLGRAARSYVIENHDWDSRADKVTEVYRKSRGKQIQKHIQ